MHVKSAVRSDAGPYKVTLKNRFGGDSCRLNVNVLDRPGPPQGPLDATDIEADAMTLHWRPPKDNGGEEITNYILEKKDKKGDWVRVSNSILGNSYRVRNLQEGMAYEFRVMAENQYGISDPLCTMEPIVAKHPFNPPGPPGQPRALETSEDSILLTWSRPTTDGGSPIQGYVVEKREKGQSSWIKCSFALIPDLKYRVPGLIAHKCYEFRVCAVNAAGPGAFSETSEPIYASQPPCAPKIDLSMLAKDILALAGDPFKIMVPYQAVPPPTVVWSKAGKDLGASKRVDLETTEYVTMYHNKSCERGDAGHYTVTLTNDLGSDSATVKVTVVGKFFSISLRR